MICLSLYREHMSNEHMGVWELQNIFYVLAECVKSYLFTNQDSQQA